MLIHLTSQLNLKALLGKILNILFIGTLIFHSPPLAFAQKKYVKGEIITTYLDTIRGFILNRPAFTNMDQVVFSFDRSGKVLETYYPDQIAKVIIDKKEFLSVPASYNDLNKIFFLRRICFGHYNLYEAYQNDGNKIFFLQTENEEVIYLPKKFKDEWIAQYFSEHSFKPPRVYYDDVSLTNLVSKYSSWMQPEMFVYQREKFKPVVNIGLKIGSTLSLMEFTDRINDYRGVNFDPGLGLQGGVVFNIDAARHLQVTAEILYSSIRGKLSDTVTFDFQRSDVNIPILLRYVVSSDSRFNPYFNIGLDGRILLKDQFRLINIDEEIDFKPAKGVIGLLIGAGTFIKLTHTMDLFVDVRYSVSSYLAHSWPKEKYTLRNQVFSLTTGILF